MPQHHLIAALALDTLLRSSHDRSRDVPFAAPNSFLIDRRLERAGRQQARERQLQETGPPMYRPSVALTALTDGQPRRTAVADADARVSRDGDRHGEHPTPPPPRLTV